MITTIPKSFEKPILYGLGFAAAFIAYRLYARGISGTASDVAGGLVKGVVNATAGIIGGVVTATGEVVADGYNSLPNSVKPSSSDNIAYTATNRIGAALTGDKDFSFGVFIYDVIN